MRWYVLIIIIIIIIIILIIIVIIDVLIDVCYIAFDTLLFTTFTS